MATNSMLQRCTNFDMPHHIIKVIDPIERVAMVMGFCPCNL